MSFLSKDRGERRDRESPASFAAQVGAFGKVPNVADFVRARADSSAAHAFEELIAEAMAWGDARRGARWASAFSNGAPHAFIHRARSSAGVCLSGVIRPSHDAVGRLFPIAVALPLSERAHANAPHLLPLVLGEFLSDASELATAADSLTSGSALDGLVGQARVPSLDATAAGSDYARFLTSTTLGAAWNAIFGSSDATHGVHAVLGVVEAVAPVRGEEPPTTRLSVRLPLGTAGPAAAAFWIDVVRTAARWQHTVPTAFWFFDGARGTITIQLGDTPASALVELWSPDPDSEHVCDFTDASAAERTSRVSTRMPQRVLEVLHHAESPVGRLFEALAQS